VTREDALGTLTEIAEFFRRTEPQSPLAYTIDEAIRRGRLSWPELLAELVSDQAVRNNILNSLGIKPV
jgi:type VI secretion system protein ImpA